jgi:transcriptional regulator with XRE-family HTH domain
MQMAQEQIYVSEFEAIRSRGYRRAMGGVIAKKIKSLRLERGWNQTELAERLGVTQASVSRWEKGSVPDADKLAQLAEMSGESVRSFIDDKGAEATTSPVLNRYWVRGAVAAGVFAPAYEWPEDDWTPYSGLAEVEAPTGTRYGLEVKGDSMNLLYPPGTILDCVLLEPYVDRYGAIPSGKRVIVERRSITAEVEATVKEYVVTEDGTEWLVPRSSNPAFQSPISATAPGDGIAEVKIVAVVVGSYRAEP